jgi:magnesium chelatase family protein
VIIARVERVLSLPARFMLLAAYNPCPCGWFEVDGHLCACEDGMRRRYQGRLSGPMRDRLDMIVTLEPVGTLRRSRQGEPSAEVAARIARAVAIQAERQGTVNADVPTGAIGDATGFGLTVRSLIDARGRQMGLSMRRLHRAARGARTIADLDGSDAVRPDHVDEALIHRPKEVRA